MKRSLVILSLAVLATSRVAAQTPAAPMDLGNRSQPPTFAWFFSVGTQQIEWGDVKTAFTGSGYAAPASQVLQIGGGGYGVRNRILFGGEGYGYLGQNVASGGGRDVRAVGGAGFFNLGYAVVERHNLRIYPLLGIGGTSVSFRIDQAGGAGIGPNVNNPTFGQVIQNPGQRSMLSSGGFALSIGGGADFVPAVRRRARGTYGLLLGVRAGYVFAPIRGDWKLYDLPVTGGPNNIGKGFFVRFSIGGAGRRAAAHACGNGMTCPHCAGMEGHDHDGSGPRCAM